MADLSDFEVREIKESISRFSKKYSEISSALSCARYDSTISSAESKLSTYARAEDAALKAAQKIIEKGYSGSGGFFSREGFDRMLSKKSEEFGNKVLKILSDYGTTISQIQSALPKIGGASVDYSRFSSSDYSGDTEFNVFSADSSFAASVNTESIRTANVVEKEEISFEDEKTDDSPLVAEPVNVVIPRENKTPRVEVRSKPATEQKTSKRIVIKANTPLDTVEIKETFLNRNAKLGLTMAELDQGIVAANSDTDKDRILFEALKIKRLRDLEENSFWNYAISLQEIIKLSRKFELEDEALSAIFGLFFLDSSGYRMVNGKYNPYKQDGTQMYYHPKMQMADLCEIRASHPLSDDELAKKYRSSQYVLELNNKIKDAYYTIEDSISLMLMALKDPEYKFFPYLSGVNRRG